MCKRSFGTNIATYEPEFIQDQQLEQVAKVESIGDFETDYNYGIS